jgi:L-malate glycosyltransferase
VKINQIVPSLNFGDAVSSDVIAIRDALQKKGYESDIYAKLIHPKVIKQAKHLSLYHGNPSNILIYHFAVAGRDVTDFVKNLPDKKILLYHNITPAEYFYNYDDVLYDLCSRGRKELAGLSKHFEMGLGDSTFNCMELEKLGFKCTSTLPILIDFKKYEVFDEKLDSKLKQNGKKKIIFVGRIAPNKKQEDVIKTFYFYCKYINKSSTLYLIGRREINPYVKQLEELVETLELSENVVFTGVLNDNELNSYYRNADVFLCMSEHEGFCVPLVESMHFDLPIVAYNSSAISETLGNSGILLNEKNYVLSAELLNVLIEDSSFREAIIKNQRKKLSDYSKNKIEGRLFEIIDFLSNRNK